ncbi:hypothetical protein TL16_g12922 [Triparma laevis f. inornata]|uniref:sn-1-specific diacylglycerol lipase n=1 Tax=Triparma laevis f. inornata TaxID=1714386 RepID=A0A9W7EYJ5_9STRA|nr:hypothetical protein TL16_g12922 [Triparma laevis f. inornata]
MSLPSFPFQSTNDLNEPLPGYDDRQWGGNGAYTSLPYDLRQMVEEWRSPDSTTKKIKRVVTYTLQFLKNLPLTPGITLSAEFLHLLRLHGLTGIYSLILHNEFLVAAEMLKRTCDLERWPMSLGSLTAAIYYLLALRRREIGEDWGKRHQEHRVKETPTPIPDSTSKPPDIDDLINKADSFLNDPTTISTPSDPPAICSEADPATLRSFLNYAPFALSFIYSLDLISFQVLSAQKSYSTIYAHYKQEPLQSCKPGYAVLGSKKDRICLVVIRGTNSLQDVVTDLKCQVVPFPTTVESKGEEGWEEVVGWEEAGLGLEGMVKSGEWVFNEIWSSVKKLLEKGYRLRITGHSLGAGVACFLGHLMRRRCEVLNWLCEDLIRVYAFGAPSCVCHDLAEQMEDYVSSVVLGDDIVTRVSQKSVRKLVGELRKVERSWVESNLGEDLEAVTRRVGEVWRPRERNSFVKSDLTENDSRSPPKPALAPIVDKVIDLGKSLYYEAEETLMESDESLGLDNTNETLGASLEGSVDSLEPSDLPPPPENSELIIDDEEPPSANLNDPYIIPPIPLPTTYIPGKIHHIYLHNSVYRCVIVPRDFPDITEIQLTAEMISDHSTERYYEAIKESITGSGGVEWQNFQDAETCHCCSSKFTWNSTSESSAQTARDKHNCFACGLLVCDPCSERRKGLPEWGVEGERRVCDSCYFMDVGGRSFTEDDEEEVRSEATRIKKF